MEQRTGKQRQGKNDKTTRAETVEKQEEGEAN
jgi:hypothetical protein